MSNFKCKKCEKTFSFNSHYKRHINNKKECISKHSCDCGKTYSDKYTLKRHKTLSCSKNIPNINYSSNDINVSETISNDVINSHNTNNSNNINSNNTNNINIVINKYGEEDLSHISDEDYIKIMDRGFNSVPELIKYIHFNYNKPENQNICIRNLRSGHVYVFNGAKWILSDRKEMIEKLIFTKSKILVTKHEELKTKCLTELQKDLQATWKNKTKNVS